MKAKSCPSTPTRGKSIKPSSYDTPVATKVKASAPSTSPKDKENYDANISINLSPSFSGKSVLPIRQETRKVYKIIQNCTGNLGGNGYNGAIYGELTVGSMQRVFNIMVDKCGLNKASRLIDVGAGLGKPNFHASQDPSVRLSVGVELEAIRWQLSMHNLQRVIEHVEEGSKKTVSKKSKVADSENVKLNGGVHFILNDIDTASSLDPFTHIYMFDLGFPPPLQQSIARKFNNSMHAVCLVSYRPPRRVIHEYGFKVKIVDQIICSMHGSGEGHTAYIYMRTNKPPNAPTLPNQCKLDIPGRSTKTKKKDNAEEEEEEQEEDITVHCDKSFYDACALAVGPVAALRAHVDTVMNEYKDAGRSKRERKQRIITDASDF